MPKPKEMPERTTRQRRIIRVVFERSERPLSPDDVVAAAAARGSHVSLSTVYRSIRSLVEEAWLATVELPGSSPLYEVAGKAHHHHFFCNGCRQVYELAGCIDMGKLKLPRGFAAVSHDLTVAGFCSTCKA